MVGGNRGIREGGGKGMNREKVGEIVGDKEGREEEEEEGEEELSH